MRTVSSTSMAEQLILRRMVFRQKFDDMLPPMKTLLGLVPAETQSQRCVRRGVLEKLGKRPCAGKDVAQTLVRSILMTHLITMNTVSPRTKIQSILV